MKGNELRLDSNFISDHSEANSVNNTEQEIMLSQAED